jgi:hypothetical protein
MGFPDVNWQTYFAPSTPADNSTLDKLLEELLASEHEEKP